MGLCLGTEDTEDEKKAKINSAKIDRDLYECAKREMNVVKILILGETDCQDQLLKNPRVSDWNVEVKTHVYSPCRSSREWEKHFGQTDENHPQQWLHQARAEQLQGGNLTQLSHRDPSAHRGGTSPSLEFLWHLIHKTESSKHFETQKRRQAVLIFLTDLIRSECWWWDSFMLVCWTPFSFVCVCFFCYSADIFPISTLYQLYQGENVSAVKRKTEIKHVSDDKIIKTKLPLTSVPPLCL